jgi:ion channel-forming bestrophin family protein
MKMSRHEKLLQVLSELIQAADLTPNQQWYLHSNLTELNDILGGCERILRTPIPIAYTRHTSRFLIIWLTVLPFALFPKFGAGTLVVAPIIALLLAGINEIGIDVEEPFSLLPLEIIVDRCNTDCSELISTQVSSSYWRVSCTGHCHGRMPEVQ